jgi:hypothetical protein
VCSCHWTIRENAFNASQPSSFSHYGASSMTGYRTGLVARMSAEVSTLINVHCIAHREAFAAGDAAKAFLEFQMLDQFANKVYEWVGHSANRHNNLK